MQRIETRSDGSINVIEIPEGKSETQQQFKDECDVNVIMARFTKTGQLPSTYNSQTGVYADITSLPESYQSAMDTIRYANEAFMELDANLRARFENNPQKLIDFLNDPNNVQESISLGLRELPQNSNPTPTPTPTPSPQTPSNTTTPTS